MSLGRRSAGRGTNLALLMLLALAFTSGALAFAIGTAWVRWVLLAHGAAGLGIVLLAPWKSAISARGLRRGRDGRWASVALGVMVVVAVTSGVAHGLGLWTGTLWVQVHVGSALLAIPLAVWHVVVRPVRVRRTDLSRRAVLRAGAVAAGSVAAFGAVEALAVATRPSTIERRFTGSYERGSFDPARMPVTQWLDDGVPERTPPDWRLVLTTPAGERSWSLEELSAFEDCVRATLDCTGGWHSTQDWSGVRLDRLLGNLGEVRSVVVGSATGYGRRLPISEAGGLLLATRVGGEPLSIGHGAPVRLVAPGRRGFWWVKWVERIEASGTPWWWQSPFPLT